MSARTCLALLLALLTNQVIAAPSSTARGPEPAPLPADHVLFVVAQSELEIDKAATDPLMMGLSGALPMLAATGISAVQDHNRKKPALPLQQAIADMAIEQQLIDCLRANLPAGTINENADFALVRDQDELRAKLVELVPARILAIKVRYALRMHFDIAYVQVAMQLLNYSRPPPTYEQGKNMTMTQRIAAKPEVLREGYFFSEHVMHAPWGKQPKSPGKSRYQYNADIWAENHAQPLRDAFLLAIEEVSSLLRRRLESSLPATTPATPVKALFVNPRLMRLMKVLLVEDTDQRSLVATGNGWHWIDHRQIRR